MSVYTGHFCRREKKMSKLNLSVHDNVPGNIVESGVKHPNPNTKHIPV
jgi:hypothetical protein